MLRRLKIEGFKSIRSCEVELSPLVVLFGPNATGKSNLVEAMQLLSRLVTERTLKDAFAAPLRGHPHESFTLPDGGLQGLLAKESAELEADVSVAAEAVKQRHETLRYRIGVSIRPATGELKVIDEYLARLGKDQQPKKDPRIEPKGTRLLVRQLGKAGRPVEMDLGLGYSLASAVQLSGETRYPDLDWLRRELSAWRLYYLDPRSAMREAQAPREVDDIGLRGEWIAPLLYRIKQGHQKSFDAVVRSLRSVIPSIEGLDVDLDPKRGTLDIQIREEGVPLSSRIISEGTLRVLALCSIAANPWPGRMVAFEEPENGVHPRRIEVVANVLANLARQARTQVVVSTHSPTLVATMVQLQRDWPEGILLLRCAREGLATTTSVFRPSGDLFSSAEISKALTAPDEAAVLQSMMQPSLKHFTDAVTAALRSVVTA
jgi:predicted ATPase